jgi:rubrerythrin
MPDSFTDLPPESDAGLEVPRGGLTSRRGLLRAAGAGTLSAGAVALLAGCDSLAARRAHAKGVSPSKDVATLNFALGLEHEAIDIYQIAAESGLIKGGLLKTAVQFQGHHKGHRDALAATVSKLGGSPVAAKSRAFYKSRIARYPLRNARDVLELAYKLEGIAANEYIKAIPAFSNADLAKVAGRLVADEVMHWTAYAMVLKKPLPPAALSFTG